MTSDVREKLASALSARATEIARRWHGALRERLDVRPERVFPTEDELDRIPLVVTRILAEDARREVLSDEVLDSLRELVRLRHDQLYSPEELLLQMEVLEEIVFEVLTEEVDDLAEEPTVELGLDVGRTLSRGLHRVGTALVGLYWEERQEERADELAEIEEFISMLGHEMRDPLGAAFAASRLVQEMGDDIPEKNRDKILGSISRNIRRATRFLESVRGVVLSRRGHARSSERARPLREVVEEVVEEVEALARDSGVEVEAPDSLPDDEVDGDRVHLVLHNLVVNAVKYHDPEKKDRWVRIHVEAEEGDDGEVWYRIRVGDNGIGIPREEQQRIFQRFYRAHRDVTEGTGLGLGIAREAARQLGTEITLESGEGRGSTFSFSVPPWETQVEGSREAEPGPASD